MLLLYTIPSNIYSLAALGVVILGVGLKRGMKDHWKNPALAAASGILLGSFLAFLLYLPVLSQVLNNEFALARPETPFFVFTLVPVLAKALLSSRYILLLSLPLAFFLWLKKGSTLSGSMVILLFLLIIPFLFAFIHQSMPFDRVFMVLSPWFALLCAASIQEGLELIKSSRIRLIRPLVILSILAAFTLEYLDQKLDVSRELYQEETMRQDVYRNYYWGDFYKPGQTIRFISEDLNEGIPVIASDLLDWPVHYLYLRKYQLDCPRLDAHYYLQSLDTIKGRSLLLTSFPRRKERELIEAGYTASTVSRHFNFTQGIIVKKH